MSPIPPFWNASTTARPSTRRRLFAALVACILGGWVPSRLSAEVIRVPSVLLKLIEQVEVRAREAGVLREVPVQEGQSVARGDLLAQLEDEEQQVVSQQARTALSIADREAQNLVPVESAREEQQVAEEDLARAQKSREKFPDSVSPSELDHMELAAAQARLQVQQAEHDRSVNQLKRELREQDVQLALTLCRKRRIESPLAGIVVEVYRRAGEWVEPGEKVARVVCVDTLRAEGFLDLSDYRTDLAGADVTISVEMPGTGTERVPGRVVFVSPEVDPVNRQVRISADIDNRNLRLIPGLRGAMTIDYER